MLCVRQLASCQLGEASTDTRTLGLLPCSCTSATQRTRSVGGNAQGWLQSDLLMSRGLNVRDVTLRFHKRPANSGGMKAPAGRNAVHPNDGRLQQATKTGRDIMQRRPATDACWRIPHLLLAKSCAPLSAMHHSRAPNGSEAMYALLGVAP